MRTMQAPITVDLAPSGVRADRRPCMRIVDREACSLLPRTQPRTCAAAPAGRSLLIDVYVGDAGIAIVTTVDTEAPRFSLAAQRRSPGFRRLALQSLDRDNTGS